jgi:hypothetical protein
MSHGHATTLKTCETALARSKSNERSYRPASALDRDPIATRCEMLRSRTRSNETETTPVTTEMTDDDSAARARRARTAGAESLPRSPSDGAGAKAGRSTWARPFVRWVRRRAGSVARPWLRRRKVRRTCPSSSCRAPATSPHASPHATRTHAHATHAIRTRSPTSAARTRRCAAPRQPQSPHRIVPCATAALRALARGLVFARARALAHRFVGLLDVALHLLVVRLNVGALGSHVRRLPRSVGLDRLLRLLRRQLDGRRLPRVTSRERGGQRGPA